MDLVVSPAQVARCFAAYGRHLAKSFDGETQEWSEVFVNRSGLPSEFRNMVVPLRRLGADELEKLVERLSKWFAGSPWTIWSLFPLPTVEGLEYRFDNQLMMVSKSIYRRPPDVPGLEVVEVRDDAGVRTFEEVRELAISDSRVPSWGGGEAPHSTPAFWAMGTDDGWDTSAARLLPQQLCSTTAHST